VRAAAGASGGEQHCDTRKRVGTSNVRVLVPCCALVAACGMPRCNTAGRLTARPGTVGPPSEQKGLRSALLRTVQPN
jgi:hypothetical protein